MFRGKRKDAPSAEVIPFPTPSLRQNYPYPSRQELAAARLAADDELNAVHAGLVRHTRETGDGHHRLRAFEELNGLV